jgi:hypothetical protein
MAPLGAGRRLSTLVPIRRTDSSAPAGSPRAVRG